MAEAALVGAGDNCCMMRAADVRPDDILNAAGYLFVCPENLASMSGEMKEMFDRCYYPALGQIEGRPYATIIAAGSDGAGAQAQIDRIVKGWRLKRVFDPFIVNFQAQTPDAILAKKSVGYEDICHCQELGLAFSEGLKLGIY